MARGKSLANLFSRGRDLKGFLVRSAPVKAACLGTLQKDDTRATASNTIHRFILNHYYQLLLYHQVESSQITPYFGDKTPIRRTIPNQVAHSEVSIIFYFVIAIIHRFILNHYYQLLLYHQVESSLITPYFFFFFFFQDFFTCNGHILPSLKSWLFEECNKNLKFLLNDIENTLNYCPYLVSMIKSKTNPNKSYTLLGFVLPPQYKKKCKLSTNLITPLALL